jgi:uncharacterized protein (DUF433 family)
MSEGLQELVSGKTIKQPRLFGEEEEATIDYGTTVEYGAAAIDFYPLQQQTGRPINLIDLVNPTQSVVHIYHTRTRKSFYDALFRTGLAGYVGIGSAGLNLNVVSTPDSNFEYLTRRLSASSETVKNAVDINSQVMHGNPVFRGTRIPIYQVIEELADGTPLREIPEGYPSLTLEKIQSGLDFAASVLRIYDEEISNR